MIDSKYLLKLIIELKKRNRIIGQKLKHLSELQDDLDKKRTTQNSLTGWVYTPPNPDELQQATEIMLEANEKVLSYKQRIDYWAIKTEQANHGSIILELRGIMKNVHIISN